MQCVVCCAVWRGGRFFSLSRFFEFHFGCLFLFSRESLSVGLHRRLFGAQPGSSQHFRVWNRRRLFGAQPGSSQHFRVWNRRRLFGAQPGAPNAFGFGRRRLFGAQPSSQRFRVWSPSARWTVGSLETDDRSAIHEAISLTLDSWQDHVAPLVSRVQTVPALRRLVQPAENKSHSVGCRWRGSLLWNGSLLWERYLVAEE